MDPEHKLKKKLKNSSKKLKIQAKNSKSRHFLKRCLPEMRPKRKPVIKIMLIKKLEVCGFMGIFSMGVSYCKKMRNISSSILSKQSSINSNQFRNPPPHSLRHPRRKCRPRTLGHLRRPLISVPEEALLLLQQSPPQTSQIPL